MNLIESQSIEIKYGEPEVSQSFIIYQYEDQGVIFWTASCTTDPNWFSDRNISDYTIIKPY